MEAFSLSRRTPLALPRSARLLSALPDEALVAQLRRGNEAAFEAIYDRHHGGILSFCRHMLGSQEEGEDALQQTFISAHGELSGGERELKLKAWLYAVARNKCLSIIRARRSEPSDHIEIATAGLTEDVQRRADLREVLADLGKLPEDQRAALVLSELDDLSHADVAAALGCEAPKVKSLVFQARSSLLESRNARETPCDEIREQLATLRGGALRRGSLRKHLNVCAGCTEFRDEVRRQRAAMALVLPVAPTLGLKESALAAVGIGKGAAAAAGGAAAGTAALATGSAGGGTALGGGAVAAKSGAVAGLFAKAGATKLAVVAVATAGTAGGVAVTEHEVRKNDKPKTAQRQAAFQDVRGTAKLGATPPVTPLPGTAEDPAAGEEKTAKDKAKTLTPAQKIRRAKRVVRRRQAAGLPVSGRTQREAAKPTPRQTPARPKARARDQGGTAKPKRGGAQPRRPVRQRPKARPKPAPAPKRRVPPRRRRQNPPPPQQPEAAPAPTP